MANVETPGNLFGTDALFLPSQRYAWYVADGEVLCALFTARTVETLARRTPTAAY